MNVRFLVVHPRDLLQQYFETLVIHEPAGDRSKMLRIGKQVALCHIFSEIVNDNWKVLETKWELFKHFWETTQGPLNLLRIIEPVFHAEPGYKTPVKFFRAKLHDLDWPGIWALLEFMGNIVEDYARSSLVGGKNISQLNWLQSRKKYNGTFFTPPALVRFIADRIQEIWDKPWTDTRIFDPSVGCGHFLIALAQICAKHVKNLDQEDFQHFLKNNLFGVDQDVGAITVTTLLLGLVGGDWSLIGSIRKHIYQADTLLMDARDQYHIVIGNPPWGCVKGGARNIYAQKYPMCNDFENFEYFSVRGLDATIPSGLHAFVVPNTFFRNILSGKFREWYASRAQFVEIHDFSNVPVFAEPKVRSSVFIAKKNPSARIAPAIHLHEGRGLNEIDTAYTLPDTWFQANIDTWYLSQVPPAMVEGIYAPIKSQSQPLSKFTDSKQGFIPYRFTTLAARFTERFKVFIEKNPLNQSSYEEVLQGVWPTSVPLPTFPLPTRETFEVVGQDLARRVVKERLWDRNGAQDAPLPGGYLPLLKGRDVRAFSIHWRGTVFAYGSHVSSHVEERFFTHPRLIFPEIAGSFPYQVQAAYTCDPFVHDPQVLNAVFNDKIDPRWHWFCLAAANSLPVSAFMAISAPKIGKGLFSKLLVQDVKRLPIPLDPSVLMQVELSIDEVALPQDLSSLAKIVQGKDLPPALAIDTAIRIAGEATRLGGLDLRNKMDPKITILLRNLNDRIFCRLFGVDVDLCMQAALRKN